jgi:hypothetical protein
MASPVAPACPGCEAMRAELAYLRKQNAELVDKMLALANPGALAVVRVQVPSLTATPGVTKDAEGKEWVDYEGQQVPLEEYRRVQDKIAEMYSGGRG